MVVAVAMHAPPLLGTALANHARTLVVEGLLLRRRQLGVEGLDRLAAAFHLGATLGVHGAHAVYALGRGQLVHALPVKAGMARLGYRRGCLIGNLGQEMAALPESFRGRLKDTFEDWQARFAACLIEAQASGDLAKEADAAQLAAFFWIGWEGAVLRAKLERNAQPLEIFAGLFFASLPVR